MSIFVQYSQHLDIKKLTFDQNKANNKSENSDILIKSNIFTKKIKH